MQDRESFDLPRQATDPDDLFILRREDLEVVRDGFWQAYSTQLRRKRMLLGMLALGVGTTIATVGRLSGWSLFWQLAVFLPALSAGLVVVMQPWVQARRLERKYNLTCPSCGRQMLEAMWPSGLRRTEQTIRSGQCQHCNETVLAP